MGDKPKPICLIKVNLDRIDMANNGRRTTYGELAMIFEERLPDYHVFVVPLADSPEEPQEPIQFQVFYEKDFTEIDYNGLKELINSSLN